MQKIVQRTAQAERQVARRARDNSRREAKHNRGRIAGRLRDAFAEIRTNLKDARRARLDAWERGPLAPKLNLGAGSYGGIKEHMRQDWGSQGYNKVRPEVIEQRCAWAGGPSQLNLAPKDRVVILDGPDKGKIDRIQSIDVDTGSLKLEKLHKAASILSMGSSSAQLTPMPISIASVRLVHPIKNPETGVTRDTIINQLRAIAPDMRSSHMSFDRWEHGNKWDRIALGVNVVIPWPEVKAPEYKTHDVDTVREKVDERTFYYGLLSAPMPDLVLNELRNPYSRFRTRHESWYLEQKEAEAAAKKGRHELLQTMRTPLEEFNEMKAERRAAAGEPELTDEMLERLGGIMARKKEADLSQAGVTEVSAGESTEAPTPPAS